MIRPLVLLYLSLSSFHSLSWFSFMPSYQSTNVDVGLILFWTFVFLISLTFYSLSNYIQLMFWSSPIRWLYCSLCWKSWTQSFVMFHFEWIWKSRPNHYHYYSAIIHSIFWPFYTIPHMNRDLIDFNLFRPFSFQIYIRNVDRIFKTYIVYC